MAISNILNPSSLGRMPAPSLGMKTTTAPLVSTPRTAPVQTPVQTPVQQTSAPVSTPAPQYQTPTAGPTPAASASTYQAPTAQAQPTAPVATNRGLFRDAVTSLAGRTNQPSTVTTEAQKAYEKAVEDKRKFEQSAIETKKNIYDAPTSARIMQGRDAAVQQANAETRGALQGAIQQQQAAIGFGQTQQSLEQQALNQAAVLSAPIQAPYSNQVLDPLTGQPYAGGTSGSLQNAVQGVVQKLSAGQMSYDDAVSALSGYGQGGVNALQQALPPGFNISQSNTLAAQQGSIGPALEYARSALANLKGTLSSLQVPGQNSNIPLVGNTAGALSSITGYGGQETSAKNAALAESRQAIQSVLASVRGGTPTDYTGQSHAMLPDNATPAQIDAAIQTLETLGTAKQNIYGNPGQSGNQSQNASSNLFSW